ncbi:MAG: hypothetical protein JSW20_13545 [Nitrospiraceae bacterium]|nr:MAG: hypothetical protein JSW20_13545 [Nitrospiraceae bacterium]
MSVSSDARMPSISGMLTGTLDMSLPWFAKNPELDTDLPQVIVPLHE